MGDQSDEVLVVEGVNKNFGGLKALDDVNIRIRDGSVHAIIGPNGAGKSTFLNCLVGRLTPDTGSVIYYGRDGAQAISGLPPHQINQMGISRVFQTPEIFDDLNILENAMIPAFASCDGAFRLNAWHAATSRRDVQDEATQILEDIGLADRMDLAAGSLSRGDKRRLELAMCLVQKPRLLLLDEPTAGMARADTNNTIDLLKKIGERGISKVIIEHDMHVVFSLATRISVLARGHIIAEGTPEEIKDDPRVQDAYLGGTEI